DTDIDGTIDPTTVTIVTPPTNGTVTVDPVTGEVTYTPNPDFVGTDTFEYQVCDDGTPVVCDTAIVTVTVDPINDAPIATDDVSTTDPGVDVIIPVLTNDSDIDSPINPANVTIITNPTNGTVVVNEDGTITYTPNPDFVTGTDTFEYQICDDGIPVLCDTATVTVTVPRTFLPPTANPDTNSTLEDTPLVVDAASGLLSNDTDPNVEDMLSVTAFEVNGTSYVPGTTVSLTEGDLTINDDGSYTFIPAENYNGPVPEVLYTISDGNGGEDTSTLNINVTPVNDGPVVEDDAITTTEDTPAVIDVTNNDTDIDGNIDPTTVTIVTAPTNGTVIVDPVTGEVTYTPNPDFSGTDTFEYEVCDNGVPVICDTATVTVTVDPVNDGPEATDDIATTNEDTPIDIDVTANDTDLDGTIDPTTVTIVTAPTNGTVTVDPVTGEVTYTPNPDFVGTDTFEYQVCDDGTPVICDTATVTVTVNPDNDGPEAIDDMATTDEDTTVAIDVTANDTDIDGTIDPTTVTIVTAPTNGTVTVDPVTGEVTYTPNPDFSGTDTFEYEVCDNGVPVICDIATVTVTVNPVNDGPEATDDTANTNEDIPVVIDVTANDTDIDGTIDPASVTIVTAPTNGTVTVDPVTGEVTYTPNPGYSGTDTFEYQVCDDGVPVICDIATVTVTIGGVNNAPVAEDDTASTDEDTDVIIDVTENDLDIDGEIDPTTVVIVTPPTNGTVTVDPVTGEVTYTPNPNFSGTDTFEYQVCDDGTPVLCDTATVTVTVDPINDGPIAEDDTASTTQDTDVVIDVTANDTDLDGMIDPTTVTIVTPPTNGTVTVDPVTGEVTYTPNPGFNGTDTFEYQVCDDGTPVICDIATVTITVLEEEIDIDAVEDDYSATPVDGDAGGIAGDVTENDTLNGVAVNDDDITITLDDNGGLTGATIDADGNVIVPAGTPAGTYTITYTICEIADPSNCDTATAIIVVGECLDIPTNDCDGDGVTNEDEIADGTDPDDSCSFDITSQTQTPSDEWLALDCDGDGVTNGQEVIDGTDPNDQCDFITASQTETPSNEWNTLDCDGDGVVNGVEISAGTDPNDSCDFITLNQTVPTSDEWNALDCDGDGVTNGQEVIDGTDPQDSCDFVTASQTETPSDEWLALDCDGDGVTNGQEIIDGTDSNDSCSFVTASQTETPSDEWLALDCDGDGVTNGQEIIDGTDPNDSCDFVTASQTETTSIEWDALDCDGDGVTNGDEVLDGTDPNDPCDYLIVSQTLDPSGAWNDADCDGDGVTNGDEVLDGTDPNDPCDFVTASQTTTPSEEWLALDCDGDGVTNGDELLNGTDPNDLCSFILDNQTMTTSDEWNNADCDGDGVSNEDEVLDDTSSNDPCDFNVDNQDISTVSDEWLALDCDGDTILNGDELGDDNNNGIPDYIEFTQTDPIIVFDIMSPDGDGVNDVFAIQGIENFPNNTVEIYNRWGVKVYGIDAYGTSPDRYFRGMSEGRVTIDQDVQLPVGTYYYVITYVDSNGESKRLAGPLYINRK
ncbi:tandem-95 repeat protein, partial [Cochleicola gelatinilyticus]|uniref:tandem-95 repeat protein n=1 Tax=Cochleicola gelatinilyticus TaxID=1763537 RepID=UPI000A9D847E